MLGAKKNHLIIIVEEWTAQYFSVNTDESGSLATTLYTRFIFKTRVFC